MIKFIEENKKAFVFIKYGLLKLFMVGYSVGFSCFFLGLVSSRFKELLSFLYHLALKATPLAHSLMIDFFVTI
ncbi:hypothetical protein MPG42_02490 [Helicobacter pylori]|uniref:hypothetical protein n=1 Tax=Helicobacter pylori TaxID=210 RepID=UPI001FD5B54B|nr:hypothetical protein [Helicobacter pylori]UOS64084.1 hypothetical protein MPG42_02490 [Helicobacter pylori]